MDAISKPTLVRYSCYELGHTWTPSCTKASLDVAKSVSSESLKIYGSLYLIAGLVRKKGRKYYKKKFWRDLLQSTLFLTTNGTLFISCFCLWRKYSGQLYYTNTIAYIPCLVASLVAICLERKSRRGQLAMYIGNLALETVWRMLKARGLVKSIPNGEVLMFSVASAIYLYYFKKKDGLPSETLSILKKLFGTSETPQIPAAATTSSEDTNVKDNVQVTEGQSHNEEHRQRKSEGHRAVSSYINIGRTLSHIQQYYQPVITWLKACPSHRLCCHQHSCIFHVLQRSLALFGVGYGAQALVKVLGALSKVFREPRAVLMALKNKDNVQLGAFLASYVGIYQGINCLLRWLRNKEDELHGLIAGFLSAWSMLLYKSNTIAIYTALKLAETLYFKGIDSGKLPYIRCADIVLYSISTALVFHAAVLEPHNLRPAYWNFLLRVTGNKFATMNRILLDPYVPNCSKLYPDYWPDYDMRFTNLMKPAS